MRGYEVVLKAFNQFTSDYRDILTLEYESMFEGRSLSQNTAAGLQNLLNGEGTFDLAPHLEKAMPPRWADAFSIWEVIQRFVAEAGYEHML